MNKVLFDDWRESFVIGVDDDTYKRIIISKWPWRIDFKLLIEDVKTKTQKAISSEFILLPQ